MKKLILIPLLIIPLLSAPAAEPAHAPYNVLFIAIDDMNDRAGAFGGAPQAQSATPRMDKFAQGEKLRLRKATLWAESTRMPLTIRVPGMTARQDCPRVVNLMDLYPTLIELCGLPAKPEIDERSIAPLLRDPKMPWPYPSITVNGEGNASVRDERRYFIRYKEGTEEFYDMERDPMQWTNLAASKDPEIRAQKSRLAALFPASFAPGVVGDKEDKNAEPDPTIKNTRAAAHLK